MRDEPEPLSASGLECSHPTKGFKFGGCLAGYWPYYDETAGAGGIAATSPT